MTEHEWEELHVIRDDPRGTGMPHPVYAGVDRCENCKAIRVTSSKPFFYLRAGWSSTKEPPCHE